MISLIVGPEYRRDERQNKQELHGDRFWHEPYQGHYRCPDRRTARLHQRAGRLFQANRRAKTAVEFDPAQALKLIISIA